MAAPHIPNLLSSRLTRTPGRGRGRSRGGNAIPPQEDSTVEKADNDRIVQQTDQDASSSRVSAVDVGYLEDPFAKDFAAQGQLRKFPIINRGTYIRTKAIDRLVDTFLFSGPDTAKQIISLGAGSDTRYFRLKSQNPTLNCVYHELDFAANTTYKIQKIQASPALRQLLGESSRIVASETEIHTPEYHLHALDLRDLDPSQCSSAAAVGTLEQIHTDIPTLLISECCLIYLTPSTADAVVHHLTVLFPPTTPLGLILYEPINPFDSFGKVMVSNLAARGIMLQTLHKYGSLEAQKVRLKAYGFASGARAEDVLGLYEGWVGEKEKARVARLEMMDEVEEFQMLARHYCVAWGWRDGESADGREAWDGWRELVGHGDEVKAG